MAQMHFVELKLGSKSFEPTKISTEGCSDIDDLKESIKVKFPKVLKAYDSYELVLFEADGTTKISAMDSIDQLNEKKMPLVAVVEPVELQVEQAQISSTRHQYYKQSKAFVSSRNYLTSIALELDKIYPIIKEKSAKGNDKPVTFDTIINNAYSSNPDPKPQFKNFYKKLNSHFTDDEWNYLEALNETVNGHLHLPLNPGEDLKYLILPSDFSGYDKVSQTIAKKQML